LERLAEEYPAPTNCAWSDIHRYAALGRAYVASAEGRFEDAISILNGLRSEFESVGNRHLALRVQTHAAIAMFRANQVAGALESFSEVVMAFARASMYQPILDEGKAIGPLLAAFQDKTERTGGSRELMSYISNLSTAWKSRYEAEPREALASAVVESLSPRESDILRLIAEGLSNKEIARDLAITPETVKSHIKHIFTKLNVERRAQAVSRAQILGLAGIHR
jgi:LuxR family maltose regulon positive regulatory protein